MKISFMAAAGLALVAPAAANAAVTFNGVCASTATATQAACTGVNGSYGNTATLAGTNDSTLKVLVSAWQANQSNGAITSAFLGAYGPTGGGFGVTGLGDSSGAGNLHTLDNAGGYTDFIMLQFSRAVELSSIGTNAYAISVGGTNVTDSDISYFNAAGVINPTAWNSKVNLTSSVSGLYNSPAAWTNVSSSSINPRSLNVPGDQFSTVWLVSASMLTTDRNDGFKLSSIIVTPQVIATPEPATWAMMIIGFGGIGATLRRRRSAGSLQAA